MRSIILGAAALMALGTGPALAGVSVRVAETGGFLLGSAHRCGISEARVVQAGKTVNALIRAAAADEQDVQDASTRFVEFFVTSAYPDEDSTSPAPSCRAVTGEFAKLEQHRAQHAGITKASAATRVSSRSRIAARKASAR